MTEKTFTFNLEQIKAIYAAGVHRGEEQQSAYDWGSYPTSDYYSNLGEAIFDIVNDGIAWGEPGHIDYSEIKGWFK